MSYPRCVAQHLDVREVVRNAAETRRRMGRTIRALMKLCDVKEEDVAEAFGWKNRQVVNQRLNGRTRISSEEEAGFAHFFGIPRDVLYMEPLEAQHWLLEHPSDLLKQANSCCPFVAA